MRHNGAIYFLIVIFVTQVSNNITKSKSKHEDRP